MGGPLWGAWVTRFHWANFHLFSFLLSALMVKWMLKFDFPNLVQSLWQLITSFSSKSHSGICFLLVNSGCLYRPDIFDSSAFSSSCEESIQQEESELLPLVTSRLWEQREQNPNQTFRCHLLSFRSFREVPSLRSLRYLPRPTISGISALWFDVPSLQRSVETCLFSAFWPFQSFSSWKIEWNEVSPEGVGPGPGSLILYGKRWAYKQNRSTEAHTSDFRSKAKRCSGLRGKLWRGAHLYWSFQSIVKPFTVQSWKYLWDKWD